MTPPAEKKEGERMPERVWVYRAVAGLGVVGIGNDGGSMDVDGTQYIRADLYEPLREKAQAVVDALMRAREDVGNAYSHDLYEATDSLADELAARGRGGEK